EHSAGQVNAVHKICAAINPRYSRPARKLRTEKRRMALIVLVTTAARHGAPCKLAERRGAQRNIWSTGVNWRELRSTLLKNTKAMIFQNGAWRDTLGHAPPPARSKPVAPLRRKRQIVRHRASSDRKSVV